MTNQKTILIAAANPSNETRLRLDVEVRDIDEGLRLAKRDLFVLKQQWATRVRDLRRAMQEHEPTIVHFCGHGSGVQGIVLEDNEGKTQLVNSGALANFFELFSDSVECVVLNACFSEVQAKEIVNHIPHVIGMSEGIGDKAAIEFAVAFYDSLAAGKDYEKAYKFGCNAIEMQGIAENFIPQFFKKDFVKLCDNLTHATKTENLSTRSFIDKRCSYKENNEFKFNTLELNIESLDLDFDNMQRIGDIENSKKILLNKAKLLQYKGDTSEALKVLKHYHDMEKNTHEKDYYMCLGKTISQKNKSPKILEDYLNMICSKNIVNDEDLTSLYWRLSVLYQPYNLSKAIHYLSIHKDYSNNSDYQLPHNIQCNALAKIFSISNSQTKEFQEISSILELLHHSYDMYSSINGFLYYDKCVISNILMTALVDFILGKEISFYRKLFYCRLFLNKLNINYADEAMCEIFSSIQKQFPEVFIVLFEKNISEFIINHAKKLLLMEIYQDIRQEFIFDQKSGFDISFIYNKLIK